jgi:methylmalonyl-CoA mutase cobalamin-binding domain/chain
MHDIGKNLVLSMLRGVGFRTIDLGMNVKAETFVTQVRDQRPDVLGLSALLTTTMPEMRSVIESLAEAGLRRQVKIVVGGAPVNENFAHNIGADGYATDAGAAVALVKSLIEKRV